MKISEKETMDSYGCIPVAGFRGKMRHHKTFLNFRFIRQLSNIDSWFFIAINQVNEDFINNDKREQLSPTPPINVITSIPGNSIDNHNVDIGI